MTKLLTAILVLVLIACIYLTGYSHGMTHVLYDAEIWLAEWAAPEYGDFLIDIDGETYEQSLWIY